MVLVIAMRDRIRDLREDADKTQQFIADLLSCNQSYYSKIERGKCKIHIDDAVRLAKFYGTSVDYLLGLTDVRDPYPKSRRK